MSGVPQVLCALVAGSVALLSSLRVSEAAEPAPGAVSQPRAEAESRAAATNPSYRERTWLSLEAVAHAPVDVGFQVGYEAPFGLRVFGGFGWVPSPFINALTDVAASAIGDSRAQAVLKNGSYSGTAWRIQAGFKPFEKLGLYIDAGYSRLSVDGALEIADSGVRELKSFEGGYEAEVGIDTWLIELGYQTRIARRFVLGSGVGVMRTVRSTTTVSATDGAPSSPAVDEVTQDIDDAIEQHGFIPTLTLRVGVDLI